MHHYSYGDTWLYQFIYSYCYTDTFKEALLGVLGIRYIYPKYFGYKVLLNTDFWV